MKKISKTLLYVPILVALFLVGQIIAAKAEVEAVSPNNHSVQQFSQHEGPLYKKAFSLSQVVIATMLCQKLTPAIELVSATLVAETEQLDINLLTASTACFCLLLLFSNYLLIRKLKYKTPKKITDLVSIVHSWIKPIKGCPS